MSEEVNRTVGARLRMGRYDILSRCSKCGKTIWILHKLDECQLPVCVVCAVMEADVQHAIDPSILTEMLVDGLREMHQVGL